MPNKRKLQEIDFNKLYANTYEQMFAERAREQGWFVTKRGYPDFICYRGDDVMFVEVKPSPGHRLKLAQSKLMNYLNRKGVKCYKWTPKTDFFPKS